ncbi:MAG: MFS transporter [Pseudomonadota bacterium]
MPAWLRQCLPWAAPVVAMAVVSVSLSLTVPLFAVLLEREGVSGMLIGANHMMTALAMVLAAPVLPRILARVGLVRLMVGSALALTVTMLLIPVIQSPWWWAALRPVFGFAATALFFASEYWIVSQAPDASRGRIIGVYVLILSASYMIGPLLLNAFGVDGMAIYLVTAAIFLGAVAPVWLGRGHAPPSDAETPPGPFELLKFFRTDPMIVWGVVLFGVIEFGAMGLISVWGLRSGFEQETAVQLVFWLAFGSLALQVPVGWAADRYDRRRMLVLAAIVAVVVPPLIVLGEGPLVAAAGVFLWGGVAVAFYTLALIELGSRYKGPELAKGNAAVVLAYGLGALFAPPAFGTAMDAIPPDGLLWLGTAAGCVYLAICLWRLRAHPRQTLDSRTDIST